MKPKQIIILSVILGILAIGLLWKFQARSAEEHASSLAPLGVSIAEFDASKVDRVLIANGAQALPVELFKENGTWKIKSLWNAKADQGRVEALIQKLRSVRGELRGTGKNLFPDFEIEDANAFAIQFFSGSVPLANLRLGKKRAGEEGYFLRKAASEAVYFVGLNMAELLGIYTGLDETAPLSGLWADLSLFNLDPEKVTKITLYHIQGDEKTMVLGLLRTPDPKDPSKNDWKFLRKEMIAPVDPGKVLRFIAKLISIKAQKVADPGLIRLQNELKGGSVPAPGEAEKIVWQLAVSEGDKKTILNAGPKSGKEDLYHVKISSGASVFNLSAGYFDDLNVDDTDFVKDVASAADHGKSASPKAEGPLASQNLEGLGL